MGSEKKLTPGHFSKLVPFSSNKSSHSSQSQLPTFTLLQKIVHRKVVFWLLLKCCASAHVSKMVQDRAILTMAYCQEVVCGLSDGGVFSDLEW